LLNSTEGGVESTPQRLLDTLSNEIMRLSVGAVVLAIALMYAVRAIRTIDRTVSVVMPAQLG